MILSPYDVFISLSSSLGSGINDCHARVEHEGIDSPTSFPGGWEQDKMESRVEWGMGVGNSRVEQTSGSQG